jgi:hypothetical protein
LGSFKHKKWESWITHTNHLLEYPTDYNKYSNFNDHFCDGVDSRAHIPTLKADGHVRITGKRVQDIGYPKSDHGEWNEIHPVASIQKDSI